MATRLPWMCKITLEWSFWSVHASFDQTDLNARMLGNSNFAICKKKHGDSKDMASGFDIKGLSTVDFLFAVDQLTL
jgi:hypothetical protein